MRLTPVGRVLSGTQLPTGARPHPYPCPHRTGSLQSSSKDVQRERFPEEEDEPRPESEAHRFENRVAHRVSSASWEKINRSGRGSHEAKPWRRVDARARPGTTDGALNLGPREPRHGPNRHRSAVAHCKVFGRWRNPPAPSMPGFRDEPVIPPADLAAPHVIPSPSTSPTTGSGRQGRGARPGS